LISVKIKQSDLNDLNRKLNQLKSFSKEGLSKEIGDTAAFSAARMQKSVPTDKAALKQGIKFGRMGKMARVFSKAFYSPYVEFGTRDGNMKFDDMLELGIPKSYAEQFKASPLKKKTNQNARPFFFSSIRVELKTLMDRLDRRLNTLTR
jgi:hypothetical protein